jgi:hypothetical protein
MSQIVQRIDFVLSLNQVLQMCLQNVETNGIKITLGITDAAEIIFSTEGVFWDKQRLTTTSDPTKPCPIPPDCPQNSECIKKLTELMPVSVNAERFFNVEEGKAFLNK